MTAFADLFKVPDLRRRIFFTLAILALYRLGVAIPVPGINAEALKAFFDKQAQTLLGFMNLFSGGAFGRMSILAMGVMPYINSSIIMSLLQGAHVIPYLDRLAKEGETGRRQLTKITRYFTLALALIQSYGLTMLLTKMEVASGVPLVNDPGPRFIFTTVITLTTGTVFMMWLGEQITEFGIGNGISLMIFTGIVEGIPAAIWKMVVLVFQAQEMSILTALGILTLVVVVTGLVVWVETAVRKIPIQTAQRMVGRRMYAAQSQFLPLKVDSSGVIAVIFAVSLLAVPVTLASFNQEAAWSQKVMQIWNQRAWWYSLAYAGLIIFFCYFYNSVQFNPMDVAERLRKQGAFIPGIRPGEPTASFIDTVLARITLGGAVFVAALAVLPDLMQTWVNIPFYFGGTSILIVVGVALDTVVQLETRLIMRHYEGFTKGGRLKGRWFNVGAST